MAAAVAARALPQELAQLHPASRLMRFFERYPPDLYSAKHTGITIPLTRREAKEGRVAASTATDSQEISLEQPTPKITQSEGQTVAAVDSSMAETAEIHTMMGDRIVDGKSRATRFPPNPFLPFRNPATGRWSGARISLRNQADLVKLAKKHNIEDLLPPGRKSTAFKDARILQRGLRVKGTGEGETVKGHQWERRLPGLLEKRKKALEEMPALVREWQARGRGKGWKKWPKVRGPR
jgi:large subunit ribosomal protein L25